MTKQEMKYEVERLKMMSNAELKEEYDRAFQHKGGFAGPAFSRFRLAYKIQESYYGGLTVTEKCFLDRLARHDKLLNSEARPVTRETLPPRGVTYVREYKGKVYEAKAAGYNQFEMGGVMYPSLTACVRAITGQHQSGRRWFRLKGAL